MRVSRGITSTFQRWLSIAIIVLAIGIPGITHVLAAQQGADAESQLADGHVAYRHGDYQTALKIWQELAEKGDSDAQYDTALMYDRGDGVKQNAKEAAKWYRLAAEQGHVKAQTILGNMYEHGRGMKQDYGEAMRWYRRAANQGYWQAYACIGEMYMNGKGVNRDLAEGERWIKKADSARRHKEQL